MVEQATSVNDVGNVDGADLAVIIVYFVAIMLVGVWAMIKTNRSNVSGFFLAGRDMTWFPVGASLFSSNIGSGHFVGLAGSGASGGLVQGTFEWNAMITLFILGWIFCPIYIASGVVTMPEYLRERLGGTRIRLFLSILSLFIYVFTKISADLFAGAIFIETALGWDLYLGICVLLAITAVYTVTGGLAAVIYTDTAQTVIMTGGALAMMFLSFQEIGGYGKLEEKYAEAIPDSRPPNTTCGEPREDFFHVFRDPINSDLPWPAMLFGITINSVWYWCTDQVIVQRTLAAKSLSHAKGGCLMAGLIKILPMYMMVMVGMCSRIVNPNVVACATEEACLEACGSASGCTNYAYSLLVLQLMPSGARGLLLAVMIAALMSSLTSVFNSASTLFTCDVWVKFRPDAKNRELMLVGRLFILVMCGVSIAWVPLIEAFSDGELFNYIQSITSFLGPPITTVFVICVLWPRFNEPGAFWGLILGLLIGIVRMLCEFASPVPGCGEPDSRPELITQVHYLYFSLISFACTAVISYIITYATPPIPGRCLVRLTWWSRHNKKKRTPISNKLFYKKNIDAKEDEEEGQVNAAYEKDAHEKDEKKSVSSSDNSSDSQEDNRPFWKKAIVAFCGLEEQKEPTPEELELMNSTMIDINEEKTPAMIVNCAAILMGCAACFLFGFYA